MHKLELSEALDSLFAGQRQQTTTSIGQQYIDMGQQYINMGTSTETPAIPPYLLTCLKSQKPWLPRLEGTGRSFGNGLFRIIVYANGMELFVCSGDVWHHIEVFDDSDVSIVQFFRGIVEYCENLKTLEELGK